MLRLIYFLYNQALQDRAKDRQEAAEVCMLQRVPQWRNSEEAAEEVGLLVVPVAVAGEARLARGGRGWGAGRRISCAVARAPE